MSRQHYRVLIVEDSEEDREVYRRRLSSMPDADYTFLEAELGQEGLDKCREEMPDCVLLDYNLPDIDGLEFLEELTDDTGAISSPVIMLTGQGNQLVAVDAMKHGAKDYLVKGDITGDDLHRAVHNAIERNQLLIRLQEKQEELEQFAHIAAYEIKEPLRIVSGFCEYLKGDYEEKLDRKADGYLDRIVDECRHMTQTVQSLLEYAQITDSVSTMKPVDLHAVVRRAIGALEALITEQGAQIVVGDLPTVSGNQGALTRLFQNLLSNAIKFRGLEAPRVSIEATRDDDQWHITVKDNGIGIDEDFHKTIFAPLRRIYEDKYEGTGLGLTTCRKIIEHHSGRIWVESERKGSTFHFTLGVTPASASAVPAEPCGTGGSPR